MKQVIDHKIRQRLKLSCDEYCFMEYLANKGVGTFGEINKAFGWDKDYTISILFKLSDMGLLRKNRASRTIVSEIWEAQFDHSELAKQVIEYFNLRTGSNYSTSNKGTVLIIKKRLAEKDYTFEDFKKVIDSKASEWLEDVAMTKYLRPETLFNGKFESYLQFASRTPVKEEKKMII